MRPMYSALLNILSDLNSRGVLLKNGNEIIALYDDTFTMLIAFKYGQSEYLRVSQLLEYYEEDTVSLNPCLSLLLRSARSEHRTISERYCVQARNIRCVKD